MTAIGGRHVCLRAVRGDRIWRLLEQEKVTHLNGAPTVLTTLADAEEAHPLERPLVVTTAGAPPSPTTIAQCEAPQCAGRARLRADRDLRSVLAVSVAGGLGGPRRGASARRSCRARASG